MSGKVCIETPATTANLGPGFDCLGLALGLVNRFEFEQRDRGAGWRFELGGTDAGDLPLDGRNLAAQAARNVFAQRGYTPPGEIVVRGTIDVPLSSGLGSSASAVVAGMLAANALMPDPLPGEVLFERMVQAEGHPDNIAPAYLGGLTVAFYSEGVDGHMPAFFHQRLDPHPDLRVAVLLPDYEIPTAKARAVLPDLVERRGAVQNVGRVPLLIEALVEGHFDRLNFLMQDHLHEPYRKGMLQRFDDIVSAGEEAGACAVVLSGSGPAMAAFCDVREGRADAVAAAMQDVLRRTGIESRTFVLEPHGGAKVETD